MNPKEHVLGESLTSNPTPSIKKVSPGFPIVEVMKCENTTSLFSNSISSTV